MPPLFSLEHTNIIKMMPWAPYFSIQKQTGDNVMAFESSSRISLSFYIQYMNQIFMTNT